MKKKALVILMAVVVATCISIFGGHTVYASEAEYPTCIQPRYLLPPPKIVTS